MVVNEQRPHTARLQTSKMAASVRNITRVITRIQQTTSLCRSQTARSLSSKATGDSKAGTDSSKKPAPKVAEPSPATEAKPAASDAAPYSYEAPKYDDLLFYNVESDMSKYRIPQPSSVKP